MKIILLKTCFIFLFLSLMGLGCEKEEGLLWEISPGSKSAIIQNNVDGVQFKFCLLNEKGQAATVFNADENFSFSFSVTNNSTNNLNFDPEFAYSKDITFCNVYNSTNENLGKPFVMLAATDIGPGAYPFETGKTYTFQEQWNDSRETNWNWENGLYKSLHKKLLASGNYYTEFRCRFNFLKNPATDTLSFKINFQIK